MTLDKFFGTNVIFVTRRVEFFEVSINFVDYHNAVWCDLFPVDVDWDRFRSFSYNGKGLSKCRVRDSNKVYHSKKRETPSKFIARMQGT